MMKAIVRYYEYAHKALTENQSGHDKITYSYLRSQTQAQLKALKDMKFIDPKKDRKVLVEQFATLVERITTVFKNMMNK